MQRSLQSTLFFATLPTEVREEGTPAVIHPSTTSQSPSYASMLTKSLSDTVFKTVEKSIKARDNAAWDKLSAMFYHLPEHRQDLSDVTKALKAMSVKCIPISCVRLDRPTTGSSASCPLKVIFRGTEDKETVIRTAKQLKVYSIFGQVSVSHFLSHEELSKVKDARNRCRQMNDALSDGTRTYIVIDGRIMIKESNGKLQAVYASSNQLADVSAEEATKNDQVGGHVAPRLPIAVNRKTMQIIWT